GAVGPPGPAGPTGDTGALAFGSLYGEINIIPVTFLGSVDFTLSGPSFNVVSDPITNTITVTNAGMYIITADIEVFSGTLQLDISRNGILIFPQSRFGTAIPQGQRVTIGKTIQIFLNAGDVIRLTITAFTSPPLNPSYATPVLTVTRIQ
ncbi:hypothetical protein SFC65_27390, partial [Priestia filamentosa]